MPTPFMHLLISEQMRELAGKDRVLDGRLLGAFSENWPAFYLGSVAPDYQTISGIPRAQTHFYGMPPESREEGGRNLLTAYPALYPGASISEEQAIFLAAYIAHIWLDLSWHFDVIMPYFVNSNTIEDMKQGYLLHLALLTYLDNLAYQALPKAAASTMAAAAVEYQVPFAAADLLDSWRLYLLEQMGGHGNTHTVEIFAGRLRMTPEAFAAKLNDPDWMESELFARIPVPKIQIRLHESVSESLDLVDAYWHGRLV